MFVIVIVTRYLVLALRGHGPHASYEHVERETIEVLKKKLRRISCHCATQLLAAVPFHRPFTDDPEFCDHITLLVPGVCYKVVFHPMSSPCLIGKPIKTRAARVYSGNAASGSGECI